MLRQYCCYVQANEANLNLNNKNIIIYNILIFSLYRRNANPLFFILLMLRIGMCFANIVLGRVRGDECLVEHRVTALHRILIRDKVMLCINQTLEKKKSPTETISGEHSQGPQQAHSE